MLGGPKDRARWDPLMHDAKRDGAGGYACGRQAVVVDGWPVRNGVAAAYAASSPPPCLLAESLSTVKAFQKKSSIIDKLASGHLMAHCYHLKL